METPEELMKMENELAIKTEPFPANADTNPIYGGDFSLKLEPKFEPDPEPYIVEVDSSIFKQECDDGGEYDNYSSVDEANDTNANQYVDEMIVVKNEIVKEEPVFYDPSVGEIVPSEQLEELLKSGGGKLTNPIGKNVQNNQSSKAFKCQQCSASFKYNFMLVQHARIHKVMQTLVCKMCHQRFPNRQLLSKHELLHKDTKLPLKCSVCDRQFNSHAVLVTHEQTHSALKPFQCGQCSRSFRMKHHLDSHSKIHIKKVAIQCSHQETIQMNTDETTKAIPIPSQSEHLHDATKFECSVCSNICNSQAALMVHENVHTKTHQVLDTFVCTYCYRPFSNRHRLDRHLRVHTGKQPFECKISEATLATHQTVHDGIKQHECDQCKLKFRNRQCLTRHSKMHTKKWSQNLTEYFRNRSTFKPIPEHLIGLKIFECYLCAADFHFNSTNLKIHMRTQHADGKLYECDYCSKQFLLKKSIIDHFHNVHLHIKKHRCAHCTKRFDKIHDLRRHQSVHKNQKEQSNENKLKCEFCPRLLANKKTMKIHLKTHTGIKPYECDYCERKFLKPGCLKRHQMSHTGERPFRCDVCFQRFSRNHLLTDHMRNIHKVFD